VVGVFRKQLLTTVARLSFNITYGNRQGESHTVPLVTLEVTAASYLWQLYNERKETINQVGLCNCGKDVSLPPGIGCSECPDSSSTGKGLYRFFLHKSKLELQYAKVTR